MACVSHVCKCGEVFHDNESGGECPVCGSWDVTSHFDELTDEQFDEQEEIRQAIEYSQGGVA